MTTKVQFVELTPWRNAVPLVSGYLQAYACTDKDIATSHTFFQCSRKLDTPREMLLSELLACSASIYAFSSYVWNMGVIRYLVGELTKRLPDASVLLGGPQVVGHGGVLPRFHGHI